MFATPDEISYELAYNAHRGTSFVPEKRAKQEQDGYAEMANSVYTQLAPLAQTNEQRTIFDAEMARFKEGFKARYVALLHAKSRCVSTMIAGPANFNVRRAEKANASEHKRREELLDYYNKAIPVITKKINPPAPKEPASDLPVKTLWTGDGYEVIDNPPADRIQIIFDGKPDEAMRAKLKSAAWKWSPREGAWQRKRTMNAKYSAQHILGIQ